MPEIDLQVTGFSLFPDGTTGKLRPSLTILNKGNIPVSSVEIALILSGQASVSEQVVVNLPPGAAWTTTLASLIDPNAYADLFVCVQIVSEKDIEQGNNRSCVNFAEEDFIFDPYPNPSQGFLQIDWIAESAGIASVTIYDSQGKVSYAWDTPSQAGLNQSSHNLSFLGAGIYLVTVRTSTSVQTRRIVRQ